MKKPLFALLLVVAVVVCFRFAKVIGMHNNERLEAANHDSKERLKKQVAWVKNIINTNAHYNSKVAFFIDMRIASGKNRFFICDLKNNTIIEKGLVAHGLGSETGIRDQLKFSNINNSFATSLGNYSIGYAYEGKFGKAYKLYGLDKTNSNAFDRSIVLHYYYDVPYEEQEANICNSLGCPMVNKKFFGKIEEIIDNSKTSIILNIYY
jgi:hypothetical protein